MSNSNDPVKRPKHYNSHSSGVEAREVTEFLNSNLGNAFKYVFRHRLKQNPVQDIKKALTYLKWEQERLMDDGEQRFIAQPANIDHLKERLNRIYHHEGSTLVKMFYRVLFNLVSGKTLDESTRYLTKLIEMLETYQRSRENYG